MWFIGVEVEQETSAPPPKKNPGSAPAIVTPAHQQIKSTTFQVLFNCITEKLTGPKLSTSSRYKTKTCALRWESAEGAQADHPLFVWPLLIDIWALIFLFFTEETKMNITVAIIWPKIQMSLQKCTHWKTIKTMQIREKWCRKGVNQEIPCVYPFPGLRSCSEIHSIWLFFEEE